MDVQFVGVGEAFDETLPNNSQILAWQGTRMLLDCGYAVPYPLWKLHPDADYLDAIWISHRHADHYFGLPSYILRLAEEARTREVDIICPEGMEQVIREMIEYAYLSLLPKFGFRLRFHEVTAGREFEFRGARMNFAVSTHPVKNYAIAVEAEGAKYAYSGDGNFTDHTRKLYTGCTLLVHETYAMGAPVKGHASMPEVIAMAREQGVHRLALTHIQRDSRREKRGEIDRMIASAGIDVFVPEPGDIVRL